ncbi:hypothetical protein ACQP04_16980 [Pseudonocardia halophobica]|uniref:hypothetical protein n=1 Tax=Pseudonocardia halophobica TaxID=29401 RepID=UPI003D8E08F9
MLLDHGPHDILVFPEIATEDSRGNPVQAPSAVGVLVRRVTITPMATTIDASQGQRVRALYRLICRDAPLGPWARVEFAGRSFHVVSGPMVYDVSEATRHVEVIIEETR